MLQIQKAIRSSPKAPTFDGLDAYLRHVPSASQAMRTPKFDAHVMETQKTEAFILKQARLAKEEKAKGPKPPTVPKKKKKGGAGAAEEEDDDDE